MNNLIKYPMFDSKVIPIYEDNQHFECIITPLEKNFSVSFANLLRKLMMQYTVGTSITAVQIKGISSEFENLPGVKEDTLQILYNIKNLIFTINPNKIGTEQKVFLEAAGPKGVYAKDLKLPPELDLLNPNVLICTLVEAVNVLFTFSVNSGTGYYSPSNLERGSIPLTGSFSPIEHISYSVNTYSHYEEVVFHVRTNGSVFAKQVFMHALELLRDRAVQMLQSGT